MHVRYTLFFSLKFKLMLNKNIRKNVKLTLSKKGFVYKYMKILYLKLVNFTNIYTAMNKTKEIEIDISKSTNRIILLTGANGSGKTSILSCLHPFANNGNLDVRNENSLIRKNKEGYKEIHIQNDNDLYIIKHFYNPSKESHSIKSYIEKNGTELNVNGNVTSFKTIIKDELDIELDYLKLARLGSNVVNFIDLKTTERKTFMGKLLSELDVYLKFYQKVTNDMRKIKSVLSHLIDKIQKLSISDEDEMRHNQKHLKGLINEYKDEISRLSSEISVIDYELKKHDSQIIIKENIDVKSRELNKNEKLLQKYSSESMSSGEYQSMITQLKIDISTMQATLSALNDQLSNKLNSLDKLIMEYDSINTEITKANENEEIISTENIIKTLRTAIENRSRENNLINYTAPCTKHEMEEFIVMLDRCNDILQTTYEFGIHPIKKAIKMIINGSNITEYVSDYNSKITKNKLQAMCEYVYSEITKRTGIPKISCNKSSSCPVMDFYQEISDLATEVPDPVIEDETFVTYTKMAYQNIRTVISNLNSFKSLFNKLPSSIQNMFKLETMLSNIENMGSIYDKEIVYRELSLITESELQEDDLHTLNNMKEKLKLLKKSMGNIEYFNERHSILEKDIHDTENSVSELQEKISDIVSSISTKTNELDELIIVSEYASKHDTIKSELQSYIESYEEVKELNKNRKKISDTIDIISFDLKKAENEYNNNEYRLTSYAELNDELSRYNKIYDDMTLVKRSLSSKEGIPLLYIQVYLKNIQTVANELLDVIYDGVLTIDNFNITADEFKIPYITKDSTVKDVVYASQGEKSFISLALSFALIYQSISQYNILLLDEIDSTLDTKNREKFIQILEKQLDMIDGEQIFLISHNNMFNMYPVDIIDMKNKKNEENKLANYITIKQK